MKKLNKILCILLLISCGNAVKQQEKQYTNEDIVGKWVLTTNQVNYPSLLFNKDSTAIFNSMGDTVYRYQYYIVKADLILTDINNKVTKDKILQLDDNTLIFETLAENKEIQTYKREIKIGD